MLPFSTFIFAMHVWKWLRDSRQESGNGRETVAKKVEMAERQSKEVEKAKLVTRQSPRKWKWPRQVQCKYYFVDSTI